MVVEVKIFTVQKFTICLDGEPLGNNRLIDTLQTWGPEFQISFEVKMTMFVGTYYRSIISFTNNPGHCCDIGDRIPAILLKMDTKQVHVATHIDSDGNSYANSEIVEINRWYTIKISQTFDSLDNKVWYLHLHTILNVVTLFKLLKLLKLCFHYL